MGQTHGDHCDTPDDHDGRNENTRSKALQKNIGEGFEEGVRDEEDGEAGIVLAAGDVEAFLQPIELRITDVGSVEEGDEIEEAEPRNQAEIEFPQKFAILNINVNSRATLLEQCTYDARLFFITQASIWVWWEFSTALLDTDYPLFIVNWRMGAVAVIHRRLPRPRSDVYVQRDI